MYSCELHQVTVKKPLENAALAFYDALYAENLAKISENPYFAQKSRYLKITFLNRTWARNELFFMKFGQVIATNGAKNVIVHFFKISPKLPQILVNFGKKLPKFSQMGGNRVKKWKFQKIEL